MSKFPNQTGECLKHFVTVRDGLVRHVWDCISGTLVESFDGIGWPSCPKLVGHLLGLRAHLRWWFTLGCGWKESLGCYAETSPTAEKIRNIQPCPNLTNKLPSATFQAPRASVKAPQSQLHPSSAASGWGTRFPSSEGQGRKEPQSEWRGLNYQNTAMYKHVFPAILCHKQPEEAASTATQSNPSSNSQKRYL